MDCRDTKLDYLVNNINEVSRNLVIMKVKQHDLCSKKRSFESVSSETSEPKKRRTAFKNLTNAEKNGVLPSKESDYRNVKDLADTNCEVQETVSIITNEFQHEGPLTCSSQTMHEVEIPKVLRYRDVDAETVQDPFQLSLYAQDIFQYYKAREQQFRLGDFMARQKDLTPQMRAILVEWLVEIQVNFDLFHETLYLAVKMVDQYLGRVQVKREHLQLIGATALFISCKFEERCPPPLGDFLYICDNAYTRKEMLDMERKILSALNFDIGYPIPYKFLRRYAKCAGVDLQTLNLARFILESSLMDYTYVQQSDSQVAAAVLLLAMTMNNSGHWDCTMVHYTGYTVEELTALARKLNRMILTPPYKHLVTIRSKYSHSVFHKVARTSPLTDVMLQNLLMEMVKV